MVLLHSLTSQMAVSMGGRAVTESTDSSFGAATIVTTGTVPSSISASESPSTSPPPSTGTSAPSSLDATSSPASSLISQVSSPLRLSSTSQDVTLSTSVIISSITTTLSFPTTSSTSSSSNGLDHGDKIAIALAFVGSFLGLLIGIYLSRRSAKRKDTPTPGLARSRPDPSTVESPSFPAVRDVHPNRGPDLDKYFPIPKADRELASELQSLGHLVQQHVEDYYHGEPKFTSTGFISEALIDLGLGEDGNELPGTAQLTSMAANPTTRHAALQHIITRVIFMSLSMKSGRNISLLPSAIKDLLRDMPPVEKHSGSPEGKSYYFRFQICLLFPLTDAPALSVSLTRWRQLSVFLLDAKRSERGTFQPDERVLRPEVTNLVAALNTFLGAFVPKEGRQEQENHLQGVVIECAKFGYAIMSQPAEFIWQFNAEREVGTYIVTCPGLEKVSDHYGVSFEPVVVVAPELHKIS